ncbi:MAG: alpha/beta hydrolase [Litorimonas sp.]
MGSWLAACGTAQPTAPDAAGDFEFRSGRTTLSGVYDPPSTDEPARGLVLFIHGYGPSDVRGWNMYAELRERFNDLGFATAVWDKPGQGRSGGEFDINQPVRSSADEVVAAARHLRELDVPGAHNIGLWGISRAGWIAPLALSRDEALTFWISVAGTTAEDNFPHLLLSNLPHEGGTEEEATRLRGEWQAGCEALRTGAPYERYLAATETLRANEYILGMRGAWPSRLQYGLQQARCKDGSCPETDDALCAYVFVEAFDRMLAELDVDVLALFGERDLNIDWRRTRTLYEDTIGRNPEASLSIVTFPEADHNIDRSETGSLREMQSRDGAVKADGYYDVQAEWLARQGRTP